MKRTHYQLTFTDNFLVEKYDVPREAIRPLFQYLRRHAYMPFIVSGRVFLSHWRMGVNLILQPDPRKQQPR